MQRVRNFTLKDCLVVTVLMACVAALSFPGIAQTAEIQSTPITDTDVQLLRQDIQAQKNQIIGDTMTFTESEAAGFWPVYKDYAAAQHAIADKRIADIKGYAASYDKMDDLFLARGLTQRMFAIKGDTQTLKKEYFPRLAAAIGNKRAANFYQVDNRLTLMINLQLASAIPLMP